MKTGLLLDERFERHDAGARHPERAERIRAISDGVQKAKLWRRVERIEPGDIEPELLHRVHTPEYVERLRDACRSGAPFIDVPDSRVCGASYDVARLAAGGVVRAAQRIAGGAIQRAFCAVRPPGHHAERERSMGFCLFNNVALATEWLRSEGGLRRLAIVDWDVHHGNGTQHTFEDDGDVLFVSLHGDPGTFYPGTGFDDERGRGAGLGATLNIPMRAAAGEAEYRAAFDAQVIPALQQHAPEMILVSAGYDAHQSDPMAFARLSDDTFDWMLARVLDAADDMCAGRMLCVLEGGYDLGVLERCVPRQISLLLGESAVAAE